jgi:hypothetical protein
MTTTGATGASWDDDAVAATRSHRHGLVPAPGAARDVVTAARRSAALQAQDLAATRLQVRPRTHALTADDVTRACEAGDVVRTWLMRGTLHLVPAADVAWLVRLLGPVTGRRYRRRRESLGLDDVLCRRALAALPEVLAEGPLTRAAIVTALAAHGVRLPPERQAPAHLLLLAATRGLVCRGPDAGPEPTYVLLERWVPTTAGPEGPDALAELARRHLAAYAPATAQDLATWAGIALGAARQGLAGLGDDVREVATARGRQWVPADPPEQEPEPVPRTDWRLLPAFDAYLLGYADRDAMLDPGHAARVNAGGGWLHPVVLRGGRVAGTWRLRRRAAGQVAAVELFGGPADAAAAAALEAEADDVGRFLGTAVALEISRG